MNTYHYYNSPINSYQSLMTIPLTNPIIRGFLADHNHYYLLTQTLKNPTPKNRRSLDDTFKMHLSEIRLLSYFSTLIERYAKDLIKKERKYLQRMMLIFDQETPNESFQSIGEKLVYRSSCQGLMTPFKQMKPLFRLHVIDTLTKLQEQVIFYYYFNQFCDSEIGRMLNVSQQAIWKVRQRALQRLKKSYKEEC